MSWAVVEQQSIYYTGCCKKYRKKAKQQKQRAKTLRKRTLKRVRGFQQENISNPTPGEHAFKVKLDTIGMDYEQQKLFNVNTKKNPQYKLVDFYVPQMKLIIEIDGGYHSTPAQAKKDFIREQQLIRKPGVFNIVRFTNREAFKLSEDDIIKRIDMSQLSP